MITIEAAVADDVDQLVDLQIKLFAEDSGVHERYSDVTWPAREGRIDFERMMVGADSLVLVARVNGSAVGFLDAYIAKAASTRLPVSFGVLRGMYVEAEHRRGGIGQLLVGRFLSWARALGCVEAQVNAYAANDQAQQLYLTNGFRPLSVELVMDL